MGNVKKNRSKAKHKKEERRKEKRAFVNPFTDSVFGEEPSTNANDVTRSEYAPPLTPRAQLEAAVAAIPFVPAERLSYADSARRDPVFNFAAWKVS